MTTVPERTWHATPKDVERYRAGGLTSSGSASIEAHLLDCASCRALVTSSVPDAVIDRMWTGTARRIDAPRRSWFERLATAVGVPPHLARVAGVTPTLRASYLLAVAAVSSLAALMAYTRAGPATFVVAAPLVSVGGVAVAFSATDRQVRELESSTAFGGLRLLLVRTATVVAASMGICAMAALLLPDLGVETVAWFLPALALASATLAVSTRTTPRNAAAVVAVGYLIAVLAIEANVPADLRPTSESIGPLVAPLQVASLALLLLSSGLFVARRWAVDLPTR